MKASEYHLHRQSMAHADGDDWNAAFHAGGDSASADIAAAIRARNTTETPT